MLIEQIDDIYLLIEQNHDIYVNRTKSTDI